MTEKLPEADVRSEITEAAEACSAALPELLERQYDNLLMIARQIFAGEARNNSMNPTALVHEAYLRLIDQPRVSARGTLFFRACFARECRRILVEHARRRRALRRGGDRGRESLADHSGLGIGGEMGVLEVNDAIESLAALDPRMGRIADLRLFSGLTIEECALSMDLAPRTIVKQWGFAQAYLRKQLG